MENQKLRLLYQNFFTKNDIRMILRQDDYFIYPPITNNFKRRKEKEWRGMKEVKLDLLDAHVQAFKDRGSIY